MYFQKKHKQTTKSLIKLILICIGIGLILYGIFEFWQVHKVNKESESNNTIVSTTTDEPSESVPAKDCKEFISSDSSPYKITITKINIENCIQRVSTDQHNNIAAPNNIHIAGWYKDGPLPGKTGVSLIDGHVNGRYSKGIFSRLNELGPGDSIEINLSSGEVKKFEVIESNEFTVEQAAKEMLKQHSYIDRQLTLITCTGNYIDTERTYDKRLIVRTKLIE